MAESCQRAALVFMAMREASGLVELSAFGPMADDLQSLAMLCLAEQRLIDVLLE